VQANVDEEVLQHRPCFFDDALNIRHVLTAVLVVFAHSCPHFDNQPVGIGDLHERAI
jgi:hypothetical protein